jgi:Sec-independent protein translocase protein TatA
VALSRVSAFALSKEFIFNMIFEKFPGLHSEMLAESFSRYIREFRKPCGKKRTDIIKELNKKKKYSQINVDSLKKTERKQTTEKNIPGEQQKVAFTDA